MSEEDPAAMEDRGALTLPTFGGRLVAGIMAGGKERAAMAYSKQFKQQAMRLVTDRSYTPTSAARELGIPTNTLIQWLKKVGWRAPAVPVNAPELPEPSLSEDPAVLKVRVRQLEAENRRLQMEKEILKKATAYFASQNP